MQREALTVLQSLILRAHVNGT